MTSKYLEFRDCTPEGPRRTKVVQVISRQHHYSLGAIYWYGRWRQYCFFPNDATIWNTGCLAEIQGEIARLMEERKEARRVG